MVRRRQLKKFITFQRQRLKNRQFFSNKNRVTPSVAAPGDTNPSDATVKMHASAISALGLVMTLTFDL